MEDTLTTEVKARLDRDENLAEEARELAFAALLGKLEACLDGVPPEVPPTAGAAVGDACRAYVCSIAVEGFRGIGKTVALDFNPGPGLTLVVGRNGSGKSSFAEALELLLTGENQRWSSRRHKVWRDGWKNLHHRGRTAIKADLLIDGEPGPTRLRRVWSGDDLEMGTTELLWGDKSGSFDELGWQEPLVAYRPFLSYNELGAMLEEGPSRLYDALASILGLEDLVEASRALLEERKNREREHKEVRGELKALRNVLGQSEDERAARCLVLLKGTKWDLEALEELVTGDGLEDDSQVERLTRLAELRDPELAGSSEAIAELAEAERTSAELRGTDSETARRLAGLLETALTYHDHTGDGDCPVCGRSSALDEVWHRETRRTITDLSAQADAAELAHRRLASAERRLRDFFVPPPPLLADAEVLGLDRAATARSAWDAFYELREKARETLRDELEEHDKALRSALSELREEARDLMAALQDAWRDIALRLAAWLPGARRLMEEKETLAHLKAAEKWLKETASDIRNERFQPIKEEVLAHWRSLRARSSVELEDVKFEGTATRRRINVDVTVDGIEGAALGVMSQGELHALALSLFLPRATLEVSPFRFLVIDDPVQAMDPARVDGLARTLESVAQDRQVIVFTHDNRLPEAVLRLKIAADIFEIQRRQGSAVEVRRIRGPVERYFDDAHALVRTDELPRAVMERVVPGLCRQSLEAACIEVIRRRRLVRGDRHAAVEALIARYPRLLSRLALAIFDDAARAGEVLRFLQQRYGPWAADVTQACNRGAHGAMPRGDAVTFIRDVERLTENLREAP